MEKYRLLIDKMVEIRKSRGLTQRDLAAKLNVSHCYVGRVETYERRLDIVETINWLKALGCSDTEILKLVTRIL